MYFLSFWLKSVLENETSSLMYVRYLADIVIRRFFLFFPYRLHRYLYEIIAYAYIPYWTVNLLKSRAIPH